MFDTGDNERVARAVAAGAPVESRLEVWSDGALVTESAPFDDGSVSNDWVTAGVSRHLDLTVRPSRDWLRWFDLPLLEVHPFRGVRFSRTSMVECPMGVFPVLPPDMARPVAAIKVSADDGGECLKRAEFDHPTASTDGPVVNTLIWLLAGAGAVDPILLTNSQQTATGYMMRGRLDAVTTYAKAANLEVYWDRLGQPTIAHARTLGAATSEILVGPGQSAVGVAAKNDWSKVYNYVSVTSSAQNVDFPPQFAGITVPSNPAAATRIRQRTFNYSSPLLMNPTQALNTARRILARVSGRARSYAYQCLPDPTRDAGDSVLGATMTGTDVFQIQNVTTPLSAKGGLQSVTAIYTNLGDDGLGIGDEV